LGAADWPRRRRQLFQMTVAAPIAAEQYEVVLSTRPAARAESVDTRTRTGGEFHAPKMAATLTALSVGEMHLHGRPFRYPLTNHQGGSPNKMLGPATTSDVMTGSPARKAVQASPPFSSFQFFKASIADQQGGYVNRLDTRHFTRISLKEEVFAKTIRSQTCRIFGKTMTCDDRTRGGPDGSSAEEHSRHGHGGSQLADASACGRGSRKI